METKTSKKRAASSSRAKDLVQPLPLFAVLEREGRGETVDLLEAEILEVGGKLRSREEERGQHEE